MFSRSFTAMMLLLASVNGAACSCVGQESDPDTLEHYQSIVAPLLEAHCTGCHGPERQEANIRLDTLSTDLTADRAAAENWHEVLNVLNAGEMPPEDQPQLQPERLKELTEWISSALSQALEQTQSTNGRVVLRRLNRAEYQNTMSDLLNHKMDYVRDLPPDPPSRDGFLNDGAALRMSSLDLELLLDTARRALRRVIVDGEAPSVFHHRFMESNVARWMKGVHRSNSLGRQQEFLATIISDYPERGDFRIQVELSAKLKPEAGFPILEVSVGYRPDTQILFRIADTVEVVNESKQTIEVTGRIEDFPLPVRGQGKFPGLVIRLRNIYDDRSPLPGALETSEKNVTRYPIDPHLPTIDIKSVEFTAPAYDAWPPTRHREILFESSLRQTDEESYVQQVLSRFMQRAYRRQVSTEEIEAAHSFFQSMRSVYPTFEDAMRETLAIVLIQPDFLYLMEIAGDEKRSLNAWELASRLSYFLWSTMPDKRLMQLAKEGELLESAVLRKEIDRMLDDKRADRFVAQFTRQWLSLDNLDHIEINQQLYANISEGLKDDLKQETQYFFAELVRNDLSAMHLLESNFAMLNERAARHYGVDGVLGREFRRVTLSKDMHRGGLLGQGAILMLGSNGSESHPIRRAVWILDRLLDDPPAPPPPDVPDLSEQPAEFQHLTFRERLEVHREVAACANCHRGIDPWGIALENFDAVGRWREEVTRDAAMRVEIRSTPSHDTLPDGTELNGFSSLRNYLTTDCRERFARSLVKRLMTYALGRRLELSDEVIVEELHRRFSEGDYVLRSLIKDVVCSPPFLTK